MLLILKKLFCHHKIISFSDKKISKALFLRNNTSDFATFEQIFINKEYSINFNFEPKVILDCGANVGFAAIFFKNIFPDAKIISIEPDSSNFNLLKLNTKDYQRVSCLNGAIWNKDTNLVIKDLGLCKWGFMIEESSDTNLGSIKAYTIESIMKMFDINQIDIIKIDIEGSEKELFECNFEKWLPNTKMIIIELHDSMRAGSSKSFFKALSNYDYSLDFKGENIIINMN